MNNRLKKRAKITVIIFITLFTSLLSIMLVTGDQQTAYDGSWSAGRNEPGNTGIQQLTGTIETPRLSEFTFERGAVSGQPYFSDITGDDDPEIFFIDSGKIVAKAHNGDLIWISDLILAMQIYSVDDLNGNGEKEVLVFGQNQMIILDANDGSVLFRENFQSQISRPRFLLNDFNKDGAKEAIIWIYGDNDLYIYKFVDDNGRFDAHIINRIDGSKDRVDVFYPGFAYADTNNDGYEEFVLIRYGGVSIYDAKLLTTEEGKGTDPISRIDYIPKGADNGRFYGYFTMKDITGDGVSDGVIVADGVSMHIGVMEGSVGEGITKLWDKYYGYSGRRGADGKNVIMKVVNDALIDAGGNGQQQIVYGIFEYVDGSATGDWTLKIINATDYNDENNTYLQGYYLWAIEDIGAGVPLFFLSKENSANPGRPASYEIFAFNSEGEFKKITDLSYTLIQKSVSAPGDVSPASYSGETRLYVLDADRNGTDELLVSKNGTYELLNISSNGNISVIGSIKPEKGSIYDHYWNADGDLFVVTADGEGIMRVYDMDGNELWEYQCGGSFNASFLIGDVSGDGKNSLIVALDNMIHIYNVTDVEDYKLVNSFKGSSPMLADMDGDGVYDIIVRSSMNEKPGIAVLDSSGQEKWSYFVDKDLNGDSLGFNAMRDFAVGDFNGDGHKDVAIGLQNTYPLGRTAIIDGEKKELVYITSATTQIMYAHGGGMKVDRATLAQPGKFAVSDINKDGKDELYFVSLEAFMRVTEADGEYKLDTYVAQINPDLCRIYYSTPYIFDLTGDGTDDFFFGAGFNSVSVYNGNMNMTAQTRATNPLWNLVLSNYSELMYRDQGIAISDINGTKSSLIGIQFTSGTTDETGSFAAFDSTTGDLQWRYDMKNDFGGTNVSAQNILSCDVNNDGNMEYIVATNTGYVIAFNNDIEISNDSDRVLWSVNIAASVSNLAIGDIYNDGTSQIVLAASDGYIYIIDGREENDDIVIPSETTITTATSQEASVTTDSDDKQDAGISSMVIYTIIVLIVLAVVAALIIYVKKIRK